MIKKLNTPKLVLLCLALFTLVFSAQASQWVDEFENPLEVSLADPAILKDGSNYYVYGTGMSCFASTNLIDWREKFWLYSAPGGDTRTNFWAPEVIKRPSDGKYLMFYTAQAPGAKLKIYLAQSTSPTGSFTDVYGTTPLFDTHAGDAWIDASPFIDTDGNAYIYVTKDISSDSGRPDRGAIFVLTLNLTTLTVGTPVKVLSPNTSGWELRPDGADIEGPYMVKHNSQYFLFYSGNGAWTQNYAVGYAVSTSPTSGFVKYAGNPILSKNTGLYGPGHCSVALSPDGQEYFMFYHAKLVAADGWTRQMAMDRINFVGNPGAETVRLSGVKTSGGQLASAVPQMLPSNTSSQAYFNGTENFDSLDLARWHFFGENLWNASVSGGILSIAAGSADVVGLGNGISNLALSYAGHNNVWQVTTKINDWAPTVNGQMQFVTIWKDQQNFVRLSDIYNSGRKFRVLKEEAGVTTYTDYTNSLPNTKWLRIKKNGGHMNYYVSSDGTSFTELGTGYDVNWAVGRQLQQGVGTVCPSGNSLTAKFDSVVSEIVTAHTVGYSDEFNDNAVERQAWIIHSEDQTMFAEQDSTRLRIRTQDGDWANTRTDLRNVFLQSAKSGDWTITTNVQTPTIDGNYEQGFIMVANNHNNFIKLSRAYINGRRLEAGVESNGVWSANNIADPVAAGTYEQLRIRKVGTTYYCESSANGTTWTSVGTKTATWTPMFVGIGAQSPGTAHQHDYYFDWFHVN